MSDEKVVYELEINQPNLPKGELVQIPGLGAFANGEKHEITEPEHEAFRAFNQTSVPITDEETGAIVGAERKNGPTLLEASKSMYGVEVATVARQKKNNDGGDN